jgi:hypothetical protein
MGTMITAKYDSSGNLIVEPNSGAVLPMSSNGDILANIIPRTGSMDALMTIGGGAGEVAASTDKNSLVLYNGVVGGAQAVGGMQGAELIYTVTNANATAVIDCRHVRSLRLIADPALTTSITNINIKLPLPVINGKPYIRQLDIYSEDVYVLGNAVGQYGTITTTNQPEYAADAVYAIGGPDAPGGAYSTSVLKLVDSYDAGFNAAPILQLLYDRAAGWLSRPLGKMLGGTGLVTTVAGTLGQQLAGSVLGAVSLAASGTVYTLSTITIATAAGFWLFEGSVTFTWTAAAVFTKLEAGMCESLTTLGSTANTISSPNIGAALTAGSLTLPFRTTCIGQPSALSMTARATFSTAGITATMNGYKTTRIG